MLRVKVWSSSLHSMWYQVSHTSQQTIQIRMNANICNAFLFPPSYLRGSSYGGGLAQLSGMTHLCEISSSFKNSYKNMCLYEKWTSLPRCDLNLFCRDPRRWDENFSYEHVQVGQPGKVGSIFLVMRMYMFCFGIKRFDLCMTTTNTTIATVGKKNKRLSL